MSVYSDYARNVADIRSRGAAERAASMRERGQIWGQTIASIGQVASKAVAEIPELQKHAEEQAKQTKIADIFKNHPGDLDGAIEEVHTVDPVFGQKLRQQKDQADKAAYEFKTAQYENQMKGIMFLSNLVGAAKDQDSYTHALYTAHAAGLDVSQIPPEYDPHVVEGFNRQLLTAQQRLELDRPKPPELKIVPPGAKAIDAAGKVVMENPREPAPEKPPTLGSFEDYVKRSFGENPTPEQIRQARKDYQQADDRPRVTVTTSGGDVAMSPDAVDTAAHRVMLFGPSSIPTRFNDNDKKTILNREAEINKAIGNTPAVAAMRSAVQKADQGALNKITTLAAAAEAFENKALQQADLVKSLSEKVDRTKLPLVNGVLVSGKALLGNTPAHLLANALLTYTSEYAKLIEGSAGSAAGSSDSARLAAATLVSKALSKGTLNATVDQMNKEMAMTRNGYNTTIQDITERMGGGTATPTAAPKPTGRFNPATGKVEPIQ